MAKSQNKGGGGSKPKGRVKTQKRGGYSGSGSGTPKIPQNLGSGAGTPKKKKTT